MLNSYEINNFRNDLHTTLTLPTEVGYMSISAEKKFDFEVKNVPLLNETMLTNNQTLNLLSGYDPTLVPPQSLQDDDYILHLLLNMKARMIDLPMKFISYRGTLTKICSFPYEDKENLFLAAIKLNGKIFLWWYNVDDQNTINSDQLKNTFAGHRFEKLITHMPGDKVNDEPLYQGSFLSAVRTKVHSNVFSHDLLYVGEIDCLRQRDGKYIEIKSRIKRQNDYALKRFCFLKWWLQSYLIGIETVIVGYKGNDFIVDDIKEYDIKYFYRSVRGLNKGQDLWNPNTCFNFLGNFLTKVEEEMSDYAESNICLIDFQAQFKKIKFRRSTQVESPTNDFIPYWFRTEWIKK